VDVFNKQLEQPKYSRMVSTAEIEANDYNLNIPRYIDSSEAEDLQDIAAHLMGGIPNADIKALADYWQVFPTVQKQLFKAGSRPGYSEIKVAAGEIKSTIFAHPEFAAYTQTVNAAFAQWQKANTPRLKGIKKGDKPTKLIGVLSEAILEAFANVQLIDPYDVYQHLMSYWTDNTMQDDVYIVATDGWKAVADGKPNTDLIPTPLIVNRYFAADRDGIEKLEAERDAISREIEEMDEEHGGEDGLLFEAKTEKGKLTKVSVNTRLKEIKPDRESADERKALEGYLALIEKEASASKKVKEAQKALDAKVAAQYGKLSENEIKTLVVDDKWLATLAADLQTELDRVSQTLTGRIKQLAERYDLPLPRLTEEVETLSARVDEHLKKMGFVWK
jgi:type I restriction enzyme M protein